MIDKWMDDGQMDRWINGWMTNRRTDGKMHGWMDKWMDDGQMDRQINGWINGWMTDGWTDGKMHGWMDVDILHPFILAFKFTLTIHLSFYILYFQAFIILDITFSK